MFAHFFKVLNDDGLVFLTMKLGKAKYFKTYIEIVNLARKMDLNMRIKLVLRKRSNNAKTISVYQYIYE